MKEALRVKWIVFLLITFLTITLDYFETCNLTKSLQVEIKMLPLVPPNGVPERLTAQTQDA